MAITYTIVNTSTANGASASITSPAFTSAAGDFLTVEVCFADNAEATAWTITNNNTAITWTQHVNTNTALNCRVVLFSGTATGTAPTTVTITATTGSNTTGSKAISVKVHTGAHATTPLPSGNIFAGVNGTDVSQSITPTSVGSCLWFFAGDWTASNTFAAIANCTLENTQHQAGQFTSCVVRPTTQPRTDAASFTIGETDTSGTIAWVAYEVQAAASGGPTTHATTGALVGQGAVVSGVSARQVAPTRKANTKDKNKLNPDLPFAKFSVFSLINPDLWPLGLGAGGATTHATTGALIGQGSEIVGVSARFRSHPTTGALIGQGSTIAGTAAHVAVHTTTGALIGQGSVVAGDAARFRAFSTTGVLVGQGSEIVGAAARSTGAVTHATTGTLVGQGSTITGSSTRFRTFDTSGALIGQGSVVNGASTRFRALTTTGSLVGQGSLINGTSAHVAVHTTSGVLVGSGSTIAGTAARFRAFSTSGALIGQGSVIDGAAIRIPPGGITHDTSGALVGQGSELAGSANHIGQIVQVIGGGGYDFKKERKEKEERRRELEEIIEAAFEKVEGVESIPEPELETIETKVIQAVESEDFSEQIYAAIYAANMAAAELELYLLEMDEEDEFLLLS